MLNRGSIAAAAPMPDLAAFKPAPAQFTLGEFAFGPGPEFTYRGIRHPWEPAFVGPGLSKEPGPRGCHYADRTTTWLLLDAGRWYTATVKPVAIPKIAKAVEPDKPTQPEAITLVNTWVGEEFLVGEIQGRLGGYFSVGDREFSTDEDVDYLCPTTSRRVQVANGVVSVTSGSVSETFKYARGVLRQPHGWYWITVANGKRTQFNSWGARTFWHPATPVVILMLSVVMIYVSPMCIMPWPFLAGPVLWKMLFSPARLHLPRAFFNDGAERFFNAKYIHKAVKAEEFALFG
jgi:hypothetical protein